MFVSIRRAEEDRPACPTSSPPLCCFYRKPAPAPHRLPAHRYPKTHFSTVSHPKTLPRESRQQTRVSRTCVLSTPMEWWRYYC